MTKAHPTRRWLARVAALLIAGAAINVLVAWGCTLYSRVSPGSVRVRIELDWPSAPAWARDAYRLDALPAEWTRRVRNPRALRYVDVEPIAGFGLRQTLLRMREMHVNVGEANIGYAGNVTVIDAGWPFLAVSAMHEQFDRTLLTRPTRYRAPPGVMDTGAGLPEGWRFAFQAPAWLSERAVSPRAGATTFQPLPYAPRPIGFTLNTLCWASVIALPALALKRLRRILRLRRGLCPACGYDLQSLPTCPECGTAAATTESTPHTSPTAAAAAATAARTTRTGG